MKAYLLSYTYYTHCQGTRDRRLGYSLVIAPPNASLANLRSRLFKAKYEDYYYEIDIDSVVNETID